MTNMQIDNLGSAIAQATMIAASEILHAASKADSVNLDALCAALRVEAKAAADVILTDGKALLDAGRAPYLSELFKVETVSAARRAVEAVI